MLDMLIDLVPYQGFAINPPTLPSVKIPRPTPPRSFVALVASFLCMWAGQEEEVERGIAIAIA